MRVSKSVGVCKDGWSQPDVTHWSVDTCSEASRSVVKVSFWSVLNPKTKSTFGRHLLLAMVLIILMQVFCHFRVGRFAADEKVKESKISRQPFFFFFIVIHALPRFQTAPSREIFGGMKRLRRDT